MHTHKHTHTHTHTHTQQVREDARAVRERAKAALSSSSFDGSAQATMQTGGERERARLITTYQVLKLLCGNSAYATSMCVCKMGYEVYMQLVI